MRASPAIALIVSLTAATAAPAEWVHGRTDDPNSQIAKNVHIAAAADDSAFTLSFRCEGGDKPHLQLMYVTDFRLLDDKMRDAIQKVDVNIVVTVDGGSEILLPATAGPNGDDYRLTAVSGSQAAADLISAIANAQRQVEVSLQNPQRQKFESHVFNVLGSTAAMQELSSSCNLAAAKS